MISKKVFLKLMNNYVSGKAIENIRKRVGIKLVNNFKKPEKFAQTPSFCSYYPIFDENFVSIHKKKKLKLNKPDYCGVAILDIINTLMYDFHYDYMKAKYGEQETLLFTDTDSLVCEIGSKYFLQGNTVMI